MLFTMSQRVKRSYRALLRPENGYTTWYLLALLVILMMVGCSLLNRYILVPKEEVVATPETYQLNYRDVWFPASDGTQLNGWWLPAASDRPLIVFFHGNAGNVSDNLGYLSLLHGCGYPIFIFDYRGFGKSNGEAIVEGDLFNDARGALAYLASLGWRSENMIFFGQSLGSAVAVQMALETRPKGLILEGSFTSMSDMVKHVSPIGYYTVGWWGINLPLNNLDKIDRVEAPVLFIHGSRDPVVPVDMTLRLYARARQPKMLHIIDGGGHCDVFTRDTTAYLSAWRGYAETLTAKAVAATPPSP
jgi:uncharacterized protein